MVVVEMVELSLFEARLDSAPVARQRVGLRPQGPSSFEDGGRKKEEARSLRALTSNKRTLVRGSRELESR